jgi:hypothetical protein
VTTTCLNSLNPLLYRLRISAAVLFLVDITLSPGIDYLVAIGSPQGSAATQFKRQLAGALLSDFTQFAMIRL